MNTDERISELVRELQKNYLDYEKGNKESLFSMAAIMNQIVKLAREALGLSPFEGRRDSSNETK